VAHLSTRGEAATLHRYDDSLSRSERGAQIWWASAGRWDVRLVKIIHPSLRRRAEHVAGEQALDFWRAFLPLLGGHVSKDAECEANARRFLLRARQ
jgi:hypothetical protein